MVHFGYICLLIFITTSFQPVESANLFVIDIKDFKDTLNYDDYGPINDYDYNEKAVQIGHNKKFRSLSSLLKNGEEKVAVRGSMCARLFQSIYGKRATLNCLESFNEKRDGAEHGILSSFYDRMREKVAQHLSGFSQDYFDIKDLGRSLDPNDQALGFSHDYFDVSDYRIDSKPCDDAEHGQYECAKRRSPSYRKRSTRSTSESSESSDSSDENLKQGRKPNRFQVVSNGLSDNDGKYRPKKHKPAKKYSDDSDDSEKDKYIKPYKHKQAKKDSDDSHSEYSPAKKYSDVDSDSQDQAKTYSDDESDGQYQAKQYSDEDSDAEYNKAKNSDTDSDRNTAKKYSDDSQDSDQAKNIVSEGSFEFTELSEEVTKKPKHKKHKYSKGDDKYIYLLQGNKMYNINNYRRQRLPYFLPKRIKWNEDDIHHLGYYWYDGPRR